VAMCFLTISFWISTFPSHKGFSKIQNISQKTICTHLVKRFIFFMEPENSSLCTQTCDIRFYEEPVQLILLL
jgi:hypothetical protein